MAVRLQAAVFDLDGVITRTERVHFAAWKDLFDELLSSYEGQRAFDERDYRDHVDGRPRLDGVRAFLASRNIELPEDGAAGPSVRSLGRQKNDLFGQHLERLGVEVDREAVRLVRELRAAGVPVAMATSSKNGARVLDRAGIEDLFDAKVDGILSERLGLSGKPSPDIFNTALERIGSPDPARSTVVEDAPAGVAAGRAGGFGLVLGVDRGGTGEELTRQGADCVIDDFTGVTLEWIEDRLSEHAHA